MISRQSILRRRLLVTATGETGQRENRDRSPDSRDAAVPITDHLHQQYVPRTCITSSSIRLDQAGAEESVV